MFLGHTDIRGEVEQRLIDVPEPPFVKPPPPFEARALSAAVQRVDARELAPFEGSKAAENAARLEGDKELLHSLMLSEYAGPQWKRFSFALAEYGMGVMSAWIRGGKIFVECKKKNLGLGGALPRSAEDVHDLATESVAAAIVVFRDKVLIPRVWDPTKGAGLLTFFIGQCVFQFPNIYRRWRTEKVSQMSVPREIIAQELAYARTERASPDIVLELSRLLQSIEPKSLEAAAMKVEMGHSVADVAKEFEMTERALDSKLYRHRRPRA